MTGVEAPPCGLWRGPLCGLWRAAEVLPGGLWRAAVAPPVGLWRGAEVPPLGLWLMVKVCNAGHTVQEWFCRTWGGAGRAH